MPGTAASPAPGMVARPGAVEIVALLVELFAFGTLALWGALTWPFALNLVFAIGAPIVAILIWALFVSPRAVLAVHPFIRAVVELLIYLAATAAWWNMGQPWVGLAFAVVAVTVGLIGGRRRLA